MRKLMAFVLIIMMGMLANPVAAHTPRESTVVTAQSPAKRIMMAGDSIASGAPNGCGDGTYFGLRWALGDWLTKVGKQNVQFVGSQLSSCVAPYLRHEGRGGDTIQNLANNIGGYLTANPADILFLVVGVNDAKASGGYRSAAQMAADYVRLIDNARVVNPNILIWAGEVIPPNGSVKDEFAIASVTAQEFNAMLPGIAAPYGGTVRIGKYSLINPSLLADGLHPDNNGYFAMAYMTFHQPAPNSFWGWFSNLPAPRTDSAFFYLNPLP